MTLEEMRANIEELQTHVAVLSVAVFVLQGGANVAASVEDVGSQQGTHPAVAELLTYLRMSVAK